jgi:hypothetical protein
MKDKRLLAWGLGHLLKGQSEFAETMRVLVYKTDPELFESLDFEDDWCFLEPRLFAHFAFPNEQYSLRQVHADIESPGLPECTIQESPVPIFNGPPPLLRPMLEGVGESMLTSPSTEPFEVHAVAAQHLGHLKQACRWIDQHCAWVSQALAWSLRGVLLYSASAPNSFASLRVHGMVFLNVPDWADAIFFLEDLAHQGAHVIFTAISASHVDQYLRVGDAARWCDLATTPEAERDDDRSVYTTLHASVTYVLICSVLSSVRAEPSLTPRQRHELDGRLGLTLRKFNADIKLMNEPTLFAPRGRMLYRRLRSVLDYFVALHGDMARQHDVSNQPYNFSYAHFVELNPMSVEDDSINTTTQTTTQTPAMTATEAEVCAS